MSAILISFVENALKFVLFIVVAGAGIYCGKKYRDQKDAKHAGTSAKEN